MEAYFYFDSNAVIKLCFPEKGQEVVREIFSNEDNKIISSAIANTEFFSAIRRKFNRGETDEYGYQLALSEYARSITTAVRNGKLSLIQVSQKVLNKANDETLNCKNSVIRALDAIHFATALEYSDLDITFVTSDKRLIEFVKERFPVIDPEAAG